MENRTNHIGLGDFTVQKMIHPKITFDPGLQSPVVYICIST